MSTIDGVLDHVGTEEPDIDARVAFLVGVVGHRVLRWGSHVVTGRRIVMLADPAGTKLELMEVDERRGELDHVAYRVADVDRAHSALLAAGCTELRPPFDLAAARARSSLLREPAGHRLQLIAYAPDSPDLT
ncbi:putative Glyoxalase/bleomycin resistance protein/dioxygenase [Modestobacter italicus]|uniref:Glyoxalase/bleomycin resistance protein/dioxygenase n=1 Tax=Modestobacter italicus (strain DSM 44449 / CECT 9708 / BC 501) TaxID=2732864 RepID=I4EU91_MODI5|nr:VOC family protein [Modestobacter marinus]CCH86954.1 putative Glyoxalase/bleomycin resistance protein/dioxygenase [Modestobacter marinus]